MEESIQRIFQRYYRVAIFVWVVGVNTAVQISGFEYGWVIFISNIIMFTMEGENLKDKFIASELGGLTGLISALVLLRVYSLLEQRLGHLPAIMIPLILILFMIIILHPLAPKFLNNAAFAYLTCACIDANAFMSNLQILFIVFIAGSVVMNGVCLLLAKPCNKLAIAISNRRAAP